LIAPVPAGLQIAPATPTDAAGIVTILDGVATEGIMLTLPGFRTVEAQAAQLRHLPPHQAVWVVRDPETATVWGTSEAFYLPHPLARYTVTVALALAPAVRHRGWGTQLMRVMEQWAHAQGGHKVALMCLHTNVAAMALYARLGYHEEGRRRAQYGQPGAWIDEVWWARFLTES